MGTDVHFITKGPETPRDSGTTDPTHLARGVTQTPNHKPYISNPQSLHLSPEAKKQKLWRKTPGLFMPVAHTRGGERKSALEGRSLVRMGWGPRARARRLPQTASEMLTRSSKASSQSRAHRHPHSLLYQVHWPLLLTDTVMRTADPVRVEGRVRACRGQRPSLSKAFWREWP